MKFFDEDEKGKSEQVFPKTRTEERVETTNQTRFYTIEENRSVYGCSQATKENTIIKTEMSRVENAMGTQETSEKKTSPKGKIILQKKLESPKQRILDKVEAPVHQNTSPSNQVTEK